MIRGLSRILSGLTLMRRKLEVSSLLITFRSRSKRRTGTKTRRRRGAKDGKGHEKEEENQMDKGRKEEQAGVQKDEGPQGPK